MADARDYTRESANAMLPEIRRRLPVLREAFETLQEHRQLMSDAVAGNGGNPRAGEYKAATDAVAEQLGWFEQEGILVKDIGRGLIDFPSIREGREVLLCWMDGEDSVDFWHDLETGFAGRQPL
ncbi:MAG: DUF2203 domain-containing protein [Actinomycetota bacterium]